MNNISLSKKNALGRVFWTLPKILREAIFKEARYIRRTQNNDSFRQYFFVNTHSNPEKLDSRLKEYMINVSSKFAGCFVRNELNNVALNWLAEAA